MDHTKIAAQADALTRKLKHYLITAMGKVSEDAHPQDVYRALSYALREEIMIHWTASKRSIAKKQARVLYYLSMEYLPGRILGNNASNMQASAIVSMALHNLGLDIRKIAACESDPGLGNGGLGRLASCLLDSLATHNYPAIGYGLRYQYGIFEQELWEGAQVERPDCWLLFENPWEFRRDFHAFSVRFCGRMIKQKNSLNEPVYDLKDYEEVRALSYDVPIVGFSKSQDFNVLTLRLWSTKESPKNFALQSFNAGLLDQAAENTALSDVLYPSDHHSVGRRIRLKQEFLLVSASLQDIIRRHLTQYPLEDDPQFEIFADKVRIQINDTHPALLIAELIRVLISTYELSWQRACQICEQVCSYTNHTILSEALESWSQGSLRYLLPRQYAIIERLNHDFCHTVRQRYPHDEERVRRVSIIEEGQVRMAHLSVVGSHKVNGVAALHSAILKKRVFKDFYEMFPEKFVNVTNGVTQRRWLKHSNPRLAAFISERVGEGWVRDFRDIEKLRPFAWDEASQKAFLAIKAENKAAAFAFLAKQKRFKDASGAPKTMPIDWTRRAYGPEAMFDIHVKRMHEYKRQLINCVHLMMRYFDCLENPAAFDKPRFVLFGGKAASSYEQAKDILRVIHCVCRRIQEEERLRDVLGAYVLENYNVSAAEILIPAADLSQQVSLAGMEASGTGNMKLAMNGALTMGTEDGANVEMAQSIGRQHWPFSFGLDADGIEKMQAEGSYDPGEICACDAKIKRALDAFLDGSFAQTPEEDACFQRVYQSLMSGSYGRRADPYYVLGDLSSYYQTQKKADQLFAQPLQWAQYALCNIAGMGPFSTDISIENYAKSIWNLEKVAIEPEILSQIRHSYSEHDQCRL